VLYPLSYEGGTRWELTGFCRAAIPTRNAPLPFVFEGYCSITKKPVWCSIQWVTAGQRQVRLDYPRSWRLPYTVRA
jgi:hypothetical protein